jgi:hypothetical protein
MIWYDMIQNITIHDPECDSTSAPGILVFPRRKYEAPIWPHPYLVQIKGGKKLHIDHHYLSKTAFR